MIQRPSDIVPPVLPLTLERWERRLVDYFLRVPPEGDASPIRSFEVTADTLALASGVANTTPEEAEEAFRSALHDDGYLWGALRRGECRPRTSDAPNCFSYLAMTLLVDTLMDGRYSDQGEYRERLKLWLGSTRRFVDLSGIAMMWEALAEWLEERSLDARPMRRLVLPSAGSWRQIGHTRRLSFPSRADARFLEGVIMSSTKGASDPQALIHTIGTELEGQNASTGLREAFEEFRSLFWAGVATTDHRFWRFVQRVAEASSVTLPRPVDLQLIFDQDGFPTIFVGTNDDASSLTPCGTLDLATRMPIVQESANLASAAARGCLIFQQIGVARFRALPHLPAMDHIAVRLAFRPKRMSDLTGVGIDFVSSGAWLITGSPVVVGQARKLFSNWFSTEQEKPSILSIALSGGIRVGGGTWLGRPRFLPHLEAGGRRITIERIDGEHSGGLLTCSEGALHADGTIAGTYQLCVSPEPPSEAPDWVRHVRFVANAAPHPEDALDNAACREPFAKEWLTTTPVSDLTSFSAQTDWLGVRTPVADLMEALYAFCRAGRSEAEVVELIKRGTGFRSSPWPVLRCLQEAHFLDARQRSGWRGRIWTLGKLRLTEVRNGHPNLIVIEGALCAAQEREFREVVNGLGGRAFRNLGVSDWSVPTVGAVDTDLLVLAARLNWPASPFSDTTRPTFQPNNLEVSPMMAESHQLASSWDWTLERFVRGVVERTDVELTRLIHPGGRDHDVFRVISARHKSTHLTRAAAILTAHMVKQKAMFVFSDNMLIRTGGDGYLPWEMARWLRLRSLRSAGPLDDDRYAYTLSRRDLISVAGALPGCITDLRQRTQSFSASIAEARRRPGRARLLWVQGKVEVVSPS